MNILFSILVAAIVLYFFKHWKKKQLQSAYQAEVSHYSNIGFTDMMKEGEMKKWIAYANQHGKVLDNWLQLSDSSNAQLWIVDTKDNHFVMQPFYAGSSHSTELLDIFTVNEYEGLHLIKVDQTLSVIAEVVPYTTQANTSILLIAFGVMVTLYDNEHLYETIVNNKFKKQCISVSAMQYEEEVKEFFPKAELIISGIIIEHERKTNTLTNSPFWHVRVDIGKDIILDTVWDYRLADRFPQKGNVVVGNFYLFGSYQNENM